jgi:hypothetical protein
LSNQDIIRLQCISGNSIFSSITLDSDFDWFSLNFCLIEKV